MSNLTRFFMSLEDKETAWRKDVFNNVLKFGKNIFVVDTCFTPDTNAWETGIKKNDESWIIVEEYETRTLAEKGHKNWVNKLKKNPKIKLNQCRTSEEWFFGD